MRFLHAPVFASIVTVLVGCHSAPAPKEDTDSLVLRTYDIPKGSARAVVATLDATFWMGEQQRRLGRVSITPDGRLLVLASQNVQTGVQTLVDEVTKHPPTYDQSIELHYFVILGKPAASPQAPPPGVAEIQPALDEIVRSQGPQTFTVAQRVRLSSINGDDGKAETEQIKVWQKAAQTNDGVDALVGIQLAKTEKADKTDKADKSPFGDRIETRVQLGGDRIAVLGATGQHSDAPDGSTLYYVVRVAPRADGKRP
jgi:hypothetical protein